MKYFETVLNLWRRKRNRKDREDRASALPQPKSDTPQRPYEQFIDRVADGVNNSSIYTLEL